MAVRALARIMSAVLASVLACSLLLSAVVAFDIRNHISTTTRYAFRDVEGFEQNADPPPGCSPIHINLVARHGTRAPTLKRMRQLDQLEAWIREQTDLKISDDGSNHGWLSTWESIWKGKQAGGELVPRGEHEMFELGSRLRAKFPEIFSADYHPEVYKIFSSQVPRASASAVAFGLGLFADAGTLGPGRHRAFSVVSESRSNDRHLRFHDTCQAYKAFIKQRKLAVVTFQDRIYGRIASSMSSHLHFNLSGTVVASLWLLCKQEAALMDKTHQACSLFTAEQVELLEWADDLEIYHLKGYGAAINYRMATDLLLDVLGSMQHAITTHEDTQAVVERARLRFAHAETLIPFVCLLGLFKDTEDLEAQYKELQSMNLMEVPRGRVWKGSKISPFGGNTALVLYKCARSGHSGSTRNNHWKYFVQVLHNEMAVVVPGCNSSFCPFEVFQEKVGTEAKHNFDDTCATPKNSDIMPPSSWLSTAFLWPWMF